MGCQNTIELCIAARYFCSKTATLYSLGREFSEFYSWHTMPGANCALVGCSTSRKSDLSLFKLPFAGQGDSEVTVKLKTDARKEWLRVILRTREMTPQLKTKIEKNTIFLCERHFKPEVIFQRKY